MLKIFHNTLYGTICGSITCSEVVFLAEPLVSVYIWFSLVPQSHHFWPLLHCKWQSWAAELEIPRNKYHDKTTKPWKRKLYRSKNKEMAGSQSCINLFETPCIAWHFKMLWMNYDKIWWVTITSQFDFGSGPDADLTYRWDTKCKLFRLRGKHYTECRSSFHLVVLIYVCQAVTHPLKALCTFVYLTVLEINVNTCTGCFKKIDTTLTSCHFFVFWPIAFSFARFGGVIVAFVHWDF